MAGLSAGAAVQVAKRVLDRDVLAIQDTSEIILGGKKARGRGYGPVGKGGRLGGILLHPVLVADAATGAIHGLADVAVWNRDKGKAVPHPQRGLDDKESRCWLTGMERAAEVLKQARSITVVSDRESDIYEDFARRPETVQLLIRARFDRQLADGNRLNDHADELPEAGRFEVNIAASPGRPARLVTLALRFGPVSILRPQRGMPPAARAVLPECVTLHLVDVREVGAPDAVQPIHWRLLTSHDVSSHDVSSLGTARKMLDYYRKRWIIEDYFRTLKTAGFQVEDADIADPEVMIRFTALAAIAAVTVTQLLRARDNPSGQSLLDVFDPDDKPVIQALCKDYEGPSPSERQTNPHPTECLAYATWVIARLGGWTGYYGKPGAQTLNRGLQKYYAIKYGTIIAGGLV